jgi:HEAT repeat protein
MAHHQRALPPTQIEAGLPTLARQRMSDPMRDLSIEPLVDILREPENALRHAAVRLLGQRCDRESVALLRGLLADADPDIRGEASTTLFNFENQVNRALSDALGYARRAPESADAHAEVAAAYRQIVACDLLDAPSARLYLTRASAALQEATTLEPACARHWIALAHVQNDLDETAAASAAVARARSLDPSDREASLLTMELAFREQRWADLVALSAAGAEDASNMDELPGWWATDASATMREEGAA